MNTIIPFNRPSIEDQEIDFMADAMARGQLSGAGPYTQKCQLMLEQLIGTDRALLTTSCTHALEMAALLLNIKAGDEVILPSFTFVSTVNAFAIHGARPVFADIRPDTLNLDERQLPRLITHRTRAIVPVHYAGIGCEMTMILAIAGQAGIHVVEDNAHGLFGKYEGENLGTFGTFATQSFHETKNITCGEGGALFINQPQFIERAEILREKGTNRARFFRGQVDKYTWVDLGSSYVPSDLLAAFLYGQLLAWQEIQEKRKRAWDYYHTHLEEWALENDVGLPVVPIDRQQAYHMFYLVMPSLEQRQGLIAHLKARGISAVFHYQPLHLSDMGQRFGGRAGMCPVTERISDCLLRLPFYNSLTEGDQARVVSAIQEFTLQRRSSTTLAPRLATVPTLYESSLPPITRNNTQRLAS